MKKQIKNHIKKGDQVKIIAGNQKGFLGKIQTVLNKESSVIIEGILPRIKYLKNSTNSKESEEIKKKELPILIHISNVMLWDKEKNQASRIGYKFLTNLSSTQESKEIKKKIRYFKKSGNLLSN